MSTNDLSPGKASRSYVKPTLRRSTGCQTCRSRKIKCDDTRPVCLRCTRSGVQCRGYLEPTRFVMENSKFRRESPLPTTTRAKVQGTTPLPSPSVSSGLSLPEEIYHVGFLVDKFAICVPGDGKGFAWMRVGIDASDCQSIAYQSSRCLAQIFYGHYFKQPEVLANGMVKYGKTLQLLQMKVQSPNCHPRTDLLYGVMCGCVVETVACTSVKSWVVHVRGLALLVESLGPEAFQQRPMLTLFEKCRTMIVSEALDQAQGTFLAADVWKTVPWRLTNKAPLFKLWDIICDLPGLWADLRQPVVNHDSQKPDQASPTPRMRAELNVVGIILRLFEWRRDWERRYGNCAYEVPAAASNSITSDHDGKPMYATILRFTERRRVVEITHYNGILAIMLKIGKALLGDLFLKTLHTFASPEENSFPRPPQPSALLLPPDIHSAEDAVTEVLRCVESALELEDANSVDSFRLIFPLCMAYRAVPPESAEAALVRRMCFRIAEISGLELFKKFGFLHEDA